MGQTNSANNDGEQRGEESSGDYYELLGTERQASDEDIKKSYRRKALELHPDRNYGDIERTTKLFAEVQAAYEVLSDPQERAWYDSHRDVFLRGSPPGQETANEFFYNIRMTTTDEILKMTVQYTGRVDYSDSSTGFYGRLRDFFSQLAKEEEIACRWEDIDPVEYPDFGLKKDSYGEVVRPFYAAWNGFATRKSYSWKDQYRLSDAPDRRVRRLLERENKSLRDGAIQEYNEAVRFFIAFVRKRDPRYQENQKSEGERQKVLRETAAAQSARSRATRQAKLAEAELRAVPEWANSGGTTIDEHQGGFSSDEVSEQHEIECVVCNKSFKSEAQYAAHERSKKHVKLLKQLQKEIRAQDHQLVDGVGHETVTIIAPQQEGDAEDDDRSAQCRTPVSGHVSRDGDETDWVAVEADDITEELALDSPSSAGDSDHEADSDYAPRAEIEDRLVDGDLKAVAEQLKATSLDITPATSETETPSMPKLGKAKLRRAKKAAQKGSEKKDDDRNDLKCVVCQAEFASKTKLFAHIKDQDHAAPVPAGNGRSKKGKKR